jgi:hypothetical protein
METSREIKAIVKSIGKYRFKLEKRVNDEKIRVVYENSKIKQQQIVITSKGY